MVCISPFPHAGRVEVLIQSRRTGRAESSGVFPEVSYGPFPTDPAPSLWKAQRVDMLVNNPTDMDIVLAARQATAHFERDLDVRETRLAQYQDAKPGAMR